MRNLFRFQSWRFRNLSCDPLRRLLTALMKSLRRVRNTSVFFSVIGAAVLWATTSTALAVPQKSKPAPTPAADAGSDEDAPDPATIVLPGFVVERPQEKGYLSLTLEAGALKISFYDKNKQPIAPDVARAAARWYPKQKYGEERAVLNTGSDGVSLKANKFLQPPFPVQIFITLLSAEDVGVESHTVMFKPST